MGQRATSSSVTRIRSEKCRLLGAPTVRSRATANPIFRGSTPSPRQWVLQAWGRQPGMGQPLGSTDPSSEQGSAQPTALPAQGLHRHRPSAAPAPRPPPRDLSLGKDRATPGAGTPCVRGQGLGTGASTDGEARRGAELPDAEQPRAPARLGVDPAPSSPLCVPGAARAVAAGDGVPRGESRTAAASTLRIPAPSTATGACSKGSGGGAESGSTQAGRGHGFHLTSDLLSRRGSSSRRWQRTGRQPAWGQRGQGPQPQAPGAGEPGSRGHGRVTTCASGARSRSLRFAPVARSGQRRRRR